MKACKVSGVGCIDINARCVWKGITLLFWTAQLKVLIDALRSLLSCFVELANAAPKFASCSVRTIAEDNFVRCPNVGFNLNPALLTTLASGGGAGRAQIPRIKLSNIKNQGAQWLFG
jgi:hypothetical protein